MSATTMPAPAPAPALKASSPLYKSLFAQVVVGLMLGIALGMAAPDFAIGLKFFSDAFLKLISMIVAPIVFCVVVHGIELGHDGIVAPPDSAPAESSAIFE